MCFESSSQDRSGFFLLNVAHPEGRHKARVFRAVLGIGPAESHMLQDRLLPAALDQEAAAGEVDQFDHRYVIDFPLEHAGRRALVRAAWIVLTNEDFPRLTSCYILRGL
jgi:hypothetical protein